MQSPVIVETSLPLPLRRGKVRDIYDLGDQLLIVATDRISAFDYVLPSGIPNKGRVLTLLSEFWFDLLGEAHHLISTNISDVNLPAGVDKLELVGRSMIVRKTQVVPIECVVRGYLAGSGWKEYCKNRTVCGIRLPTGLRDCDRLPEPIFTPATKAETGHDENISFERMVELVGRQRSDELRDRSLALYNRGYDHARQRGVIIADTKFEWGHVDDEVILIDEVLTPDSSRFWPGDQYAPGHGQPSYDKQFVRDWLESSGWDKNSPPPALPEDIIEKTSEKYVEAYVTITGRTFT